MKLFYIALFGAVGCVARYAVSGWTYALVGHGMPWGTLLVNAVGSFFLGLIMEGTLRSTLISQDLRLGLTIGLLGGFTTFSTFSYETFRYLEEGSYLQAGANVLLNTAVCLIFVAGGILAARHL